MNLTNDWKMLLQGEFNKPYFINLMEILKREEQQYLILPPKEDRFNALNLTSYKDTKVVIIGQDPYHNLHQAHGLAFSVPDNIPLPQSLKNIYIELANDLNIHNTKGNLTSWASQGVLLLNAVLTVRHNQPNSHKNIGWEQFSDKVISLLNQKLTPVVFILWGKNAQEKEHLINNPDHLIIKSPHPSPFSAHQGFFGSRPFSKTNNFLIRTGQTPINWKID